MIRCATALSPSFTQPPLSSIELLTKEMIQIRQNKTNKDYKPRLTIIIPPSIAAAAFTPLSLPRPCLLLRHCLVQLNGLSSSAAAPAYLSVSVDE